MCRAAFDSLHVAIGGAVKPCCLFEGEIGNIRSAPLSDIWEGERARELRANMHRNERDRGCARCWSMEDAGGRSLRNLMNDDLPLEEIGTGDLAQLKVLDLRLSNLCNLKCRTCSTEYSSKWHGDAQKLGWKTRPSALIETFPQGKSVIEAVEPFLDTIEEIAFAGGEPFLQAQHYTLVEKLIERGRTDVRLAYISNMSELGLGRRDIMALWSRFKKVSLLVSVDGHETLGELIRDGISWDRFAKNVATVRATCPHVEMRFNITVSVFNIHALASLCRSLQAIDGAADVPVAFNLVQEPAEYSIQILPAAMKAEVRRSLEAFAAIYVGTPRQSQQAMMEEVRAVLSFMTFRDRPEQIKQFRKLTLNLDRIRRQDTAAAVPDLAPLLREPLVETCVRKVHDGKRAFVRWALGAQRQRSPS